MALAQRNNYMGGESDYHSKQRYGTTGLNGMPLPRVPNALPPTNTLMNPPRRTSNMSSSSQLQQYKKPLASSVSNSKMFAPGQMENSANKYRPSVSQSRLEPLHSLDRLGMGRLPSLGLGKFSAEDLCDTTNNPFHLQQNTEKVLVIREVERDIKDRNKFRKEELKVYDKAIATRQNRAGTIREINAIPHTRKDKNKEANQGQNEEARDAGAKQKLNIFDTQDSAVLKHETIARLGHDEKALVPHALDAQSSQMSSQFGLEDKEKAKAIEYLRKGRQQKESVRDFIDNARNILMAQISINDKTEDTEIMREYIIMAKERLEEGKKTFNEDKDKYEKYKVELQQQSNNTEEEVRAEHKKIEELSVEIQNLKKQEAQLNSQESKYKDELKTYKQHKQFLDLLAVSNDLKEYKPHKKRDADNNAAQDLSKPQNRESKTFITGMGGEASSSIRQKQKTSKLAQSESKQYIEDSVAQETKTRENLSDIDLNEEYSDSDTEIHFTQKTLIEYLQKIEDDNLFTINLLQDEERALETLKKNSQANIEKQKNVIDEVDKNISMLQESEVTLKTKHEYFSKGLRGQINDGNEGNTKKNSKQINQSELSIAQLNDLKFQREANRVQFLFNEKLSNMGATKDQVREVNDKIGNLVKQTDTKPDLSGNKIDQLRKVEIRLMELFDIRKLIVIINQEKLLQTERDLKKAHGQDKHLKKKDLQALKLKAEKEAKEAKLHKKVHINNGRRPHARLYKPKIKNTTKVKTVQNQDEIDTLKYMGIPLSPDLTSSKAQQ